MEVRWKLGVEAHSNRDESLLEVLGFRRPAFYGDALCIEYREIDFIDERSKANKAAALQICGFCAVMAECREYAIADPSLVGIWGGTDTQARRAARRLIDVRGEQ